MEFFYREMRRATGLLMDGDQPAGGRWNFDNENRKPLPKALRPAAARASRRTRSRRRSSRSSQRRFADHFGDLDGFGWPVTRAEALAALDRLHRRIACRASATIRTRWRAASRSLFHALISPCLNVGLLDAARGLRGGRGGLARGHGAAECRRRLHPPDPRLARICARRLLAEDAGLCRDQRLDATRPLPWFYWARRDRHELHARRRRPDPRHAYAHHIQRLMVTGNFALLAGIDPKRDRRMVPGRLCRRL